jgi:hypothetical protein
MLRRYLLACRDSFQVELFLRGFFDMRAEKPSERVNKNQRDNADYQHVRGFEKRSIEHRAAFLISEKQCRISAR